MEARVEKPWGAYVVLEQAKTYAVKRIEVQAGHRLSYQRHAHRAEHWFVVEGSGLVEVDAVQRDVGPGQAIDVPVGAAHRVANSATETLVFIEVQTGDYLGEDDIERLDDDYGRVGA